MNEEQPVSPWYRQPWFWFLLIFPAASIVWCAVAITVAMNTENPMVTDDYSKEGRGINAELARDQKAVDLGMHAQLSFREEDIRLVLESHEGAADFQYMVLQLFHPTVADRDRTIQLQPTGEGVYTATLPRDIEGRWYLDLRGPDNNWRLKGETSLPSTRPLELGAVADQRG